jgi:hypothetical protein
MKIVLFSFVIVLLSLSYIGKKNNKLILKENQTNLNQSDKCEIIKIDSIDNIYLLYAKRNDSIVKIVSLKLKDMNCNQIKVGDRYNLKINSFFSKNYPQKLDIKGFKVSNTIIKLEKNGVIWDLFSSKNLKGLCYMK